MTDYCRLWESLTLGTIPILERGIGLDRTVSFLHDLFDRDLCSQSIFSLSLPILVMEVTCTFGERLRWCHTTIATNGLCGSPLPCWRIWICTTYTILLVRFHCQHLQKHVFRNYSGHFPTSFNRISVFSTEQAFPLSWNQIMWHWNHSDPRSCMLRDDQITAISSRVTNYQMTVVHNL